MSESWLKSAPESTKVHSFDYGAWFRHVITRVRQAGSVGYFNVVHGELELTVFKWVGYSIFSFDSFPRQNRSWTLVREKKIGLTKSLVRVKSTTLISF